MKVLGNHDNELWSYRYVCDCGVRLEATQKDLRHGKSGGPEVACPRCNRNHVLPLDHVPDKILKSY